MNIEYMFKSQPMPHQVKEFVHHIERHNSATFSETGSGKTFPIIAAIDFRKKNNIISNCLYVAPNSILEKIANEISKWTNLSSIVLQGYSRKKRIQLINTIADIHIINYEAIYNYLEFLLKNKYQQLVFDEGHNLRNYASNASKAAYALSQNSKFRIVATGTPLCSTPEDMFGIFKVLDKSIFGIRIGKFREEFCLRELQSIYRAGKKQEFAKTVGFKPKTEKKFRSIIDKIAIIHKKSQCLNLPPKIVEVRRVDLTSALKKVYQKNKKGTLDPIGDTNFSMDSAGVRVMRATQISSGFLYYKQNEKRHGHNIGVPNKLNELKSILQLRGDKKTVIWCKHTHVISELSREFRHLNPQVQCSGNDNSKSRSIFQNDPNCKLIINQLNICDGYELTSSDCAVYYELPYEHHKFKQSKDRIHRKGSEKHNQIIYYILITRHTFDDTILNILKKKKSLSDIAVGDINKALDGIYGMDSVSESSDDELLEP
jgi:SNF2 family DNA or RNA helicase